jgi:hypothetical protein
LRLRRAALGKSRPGKKRRYIAADIENYARQRINETVLMLA